MPYHTQSNEPLFQNKKQITGRKKCRPVFLFFPHFSFLLYIYICVCIFIFFLIFIFRALRWILPVSSSISRSRSGCRRKEESVGLAKCVNTPVPRASGGESACLVFIYTTVYTTLDWRLSCGDVGNQDFHCRRRGRFHKAYPLTHSSNPEFKKNEEQKKI